MSVLYPKISKAQNAELRLRWSQIVLKNNHEAGFDQVKDFLHSQVGALMLLYFLETQSCCSFVNLFFCFYLATDNCFVIIRVPVLSIS